MEAAAVVENPMRAGMRLERTAEPCTVVIFGASGDLAKRKLIPALYRLVQERVLPAEFAIIGLGRTAMTKEEFREKMKAAVLEFSEAKSVDEEIWQSFAEGMHFLPSNIDRPECYGELAKMLERVDQERGTQGNRLFYLSVAPEFYAEAVKQLGEAGLTKQDKGWVRVIIEKPFGTSLESARELNQQILKYLDEKQIYRIDHYLGKETVQNLLVFRFANGIFEPMWNRQYIEHVQITNAETVGVEGRGGYYEKSGVVRDMIQNHVFQVLSLVAMEPPASLSAEDVRDEKIKAMHSAREFTPERVRQECVRGQYGAGSIGGTPVPGYREEKGVAPDSTTETYAMVTMWFDNWRWSGVPFHIRSGKRLAKRVTEIAIQFRAAPHQLFGKATEDLSPNQLVIRIQPDEGITLRVAAKVPGQVTRIRDVNMDFRYGASFGVQLAEAYERLILDCILGDSTLYARKDMTERGWELVTPILDEWATHKSEANFPNYEAGSWGPDESFRFLEQQGRHWRRP
ncbi:MAG: glucose-6-phosphate 1-dehydrogenase [Acidobacteriota bacterium]|nr:glucose-6-phosphate 1-dehydrogenase [Acidobacteriota bacterium]MDT5262033.1 glucose-6-phosphate 1-dehydrogenase [Acidobacteriota bacterium]MDT7779852.1 glucose-6-phosphate 1-dehydrogenase [Acidobacteriota bacterium]